MGKAIVTYADDFTGFGVGITGDHRYIHEGKGFSVVDSSGELANEATYKIGFTTPSATTGKYIHFRPTKVSTLSSACRVTLYEGLSFTGGTTKTPFNRNRNSENTAVSTVKTGVTATPSTELVLATFLVGSGGSVQSRSGGSADASSEEIIGLPETNYVVVIENIGGATSEVDFTVFFYEESRG